jgi:ATP adenylyltransferase
MKQLWAPWRMEYIQSEIDKKTEGCIFCEFPKQMKDAENLIVHRSEKCFVILNRYPYNNGHVMIVPFKHTGDFLLLEPEIALDIHKTIQLTIKALNNSMNPHAFNMGMNIGRVAGAGIDAHLHYHIVPRWNGDTNFMPVIDGTKVVSESLIASYNKLKKEYAKLANLQD